MSTVTSTPRVANPKTKAPKGAAPRASAKAAKLSKPSKPAKSPKPAEFVDKDGVRGVRCAFVTDPKEQQKYDADLARLRRQVATAVRKMRPGALLNCLYSAAAGASSNCWGSPASQLHDALENLSGDFGDITFDKAGKVLLAIATALQDD